MEAELILLSREHLEIIFMLSSSTEVLKNWLLFRQVTGSLHHPHAEGLCKMMSKQAFENVQLDPTAIGSIFLAVTQVYVDTWSTLSKSWNRVLKLWKLRQKQLGICRHQCHKTLDVTDLDAFALLWALTGITSSRKSVESWGMHVVFVSEEERQMLCALEGGGLKECRHQRFLCKGAYQPWVVVLWK